MLEINHLVWWWDEIRSSSLFSKAAAGWTGRILVLQVVMESSTPAVSPFSWESFPQVQGISCSRGLSRVKGKEGVRRSTGEISVGGRWRHKEPTWLKKKTILFMLDFTSPSFKTISKETFRPNALFNPPNETRNPGIMCFISYLWKALDYSLLIPQQ